MAKDSVGPMVRPRLALVLFLTCNKPLVLQTLREIIFRITEHATETFVLFGQVSLLFRASECSS